MIDDLDNVDFISSNVHSSRQEALLFILKDNEAVIKMIIKGRSPTMRHVSRTHRVALDWLCDRVNLDPKIQIKYIDTKNQLADILTKGNFSRDEWNNLLHLFNISHFSVIAAIRMSALSAALKRWRKGCKKKEKKIGSWQSQSRRWTWLSLPRQVLRLCRIRLRRNAWGYSKHHPVEQIGQVQGNLTQNNSSVQFWT